VIVSRVTSIGRLPVHPVGEPAMVMEELNSPPPAAE
jgi:hypothetical protein